MKLSPSITLVPFFHGSLAITQYVRELFNNHTFDCVAIDVPEQFTDNIISSIEKLPYISAVFAQKPDSTNNKTYFIPIDPCDAAIEVFRQGLQNHIPCKGIGHPLLAAPTPIPSLPDEHAMQTLGFDAYMSLCLSVVNALQLSYPDENNSNNNAAQYLAHQLLTIKQEHHHILALVHISRYAQTVHYYNQEKTYNLSFDIAPSEITTSAFINPDHLYFALGELPFVTGKFEAERYDPFAQKIDIVETIKSLFTETRDTYRNAKTDVIDLSVARIQAGLTFLRNLSILDNRFIPSLFDIITAAKGIGGNSYALHILKNAQYYPFLPYELNVPFAAIGIDKVKLPHQEPQNAVNLFRDKALYWRTLSIKPDPSLLQKKTYRYEWNNNGICSHIPEDKRIESFNSHVRKKAHAILMEDRVVSDKFTSSFKDGIDIRETMRNWHSHDIYVKEIPFSQGKTDTVLILFDVNHDELYPHKTTWYAEHDEESTLCFYATDPFADLIGPGISRSTYGGLSLLFPPRYIPNIFEMPLPFNNASNAEVLAYGALLFSHEKIIPVVSAKKPGIRIVALAQKLKKRFVWIPLSTFSMETLKRLQRFHVLNGKDVRSFATRFIGEL